MQPHCAYAACTVNANGKQCVFTICCCWFCSAADCAIIVYCVLLYTIVCRVNNSTTFRYSKYLIELCKGSTIECSMQRAPLLGLARSPLLFRPSAALLSPPPPPLLSPLSSPLFRTILPVIFLLCQGESNKQEIQLQAMKTI